MNAVDTNILIYLHDDLDRAKQTLANDLIDRLENGLLLWQVACEYMAAARKLVPQGYTRDDARRDISDIRRIWKTALPDWAVLDRSAQIMITYNLSNWDALLIAACLEAGVRTLYSEDFREHDAIDGLTIINPFLSTS